MQWFRLYDDLLDDPKAQQLSPVLFKHWINILCLANKGTERGTLPDVSDIAFRLRLTTAKTESVIRELLTVGLIDRHESRLIPHNWHERQKRSDDVTARTTKHKQERLRERSPEQYDAVLDTDTDTEQSREETDIAAPSAKPKRRSQIPADWVPDESGRDFARSRGMNSDELIDLEVDRFRDYHRGKGNTFADHPAAWRTWCGNYIGFKPRPPTKTNQPQRATDDDIDQWVTDLKQRKGIA